VPAREVEQIGYLIGLGMKPGDIAKALGKSSERIRIVRRMFELPEWRRKSQHMDVDKTA